MANRFRDKLKMANPAALVYLLFQQLLLDFSEFSASTLDLQHICLRIQEHCEKMELLVWSKTVNQKPCVSVFR